MLDDIMSQRPVRHVRRMPTLRREDRSMQRVVNAIPAAAYVCDADGLVTSWNARAERVWGGAPRALRLGCEFSDRELVIERADGSRVTVLASASPLLDEAGTVTGVVNLLVDVTERVESERAERDANRAKSEFLATMSHEIRTPVNAIIGYADLLELEVTGPLTDAQRSHLTRIRSASRHLISLVNEVLDLSKLEAGRMVLRRERRRVRDAVVAALEVVQPLAASNGIVLGGSNAGDWNVLYEGDEDRVRQTLINLLSNAIKYAGAGARVDITCETMEHPTVPLASEAHAREWIALRVHDTGVGIQPETLAHLFEPFSQAKETHDNASGGAGLGLAISRRLARLMGGDLTAHSIVGDGAEFTLWLPAASEQEAREEHGAMDAGIEEHMFGAVAHALLANVDDIVGRYLKRLRAEDVGTRRHALSDAQLGHHAPTLIADLAVTLLALDEGTVSETFRAASDIQHVCAMTHGRQRAALGWSARDVARDFDALWQEIAARVRKVTSGRAGEGEMVLGVLRGRIEQAKGESTKWVEGAQKARVV